MIVKSNVSFSFSHWRTDFDIMDELEPEDPNLIFCAIDADGSGGISYNEYPLHYSSNI